MVRIAAVTIVVIVGDASSRDEKWSVCGEVE
jgi:hypothetical protein